MRFSLPLRKRIKNHKNSETTPSGVIISILIWGLFFVGSAGLLIAGVLERSRTTEPSKASSEILASPSGDILIDSIVNINTDVLDPSRTTADGETFQVDAIGVNTITIGGVGSDGTVASNISSSLAATDEILLLNIQGNQTEYTNTGTYEFCEISSILGDTLSCTTPIVNTYGEVSNADLSGQKVIVQRVPFYNSLIITNSGSLTTNSWDGTYGGIIALKVAGEISIAGNGSIDASAKGYRGGSGPYAGESYAGGFNTVAGGPRNFGGGGAGLYEGTSLKGASGGYGTVGEAGVNRGEPGATYGDLNLSKIYLGSGGGSLEGSNSGGRGGGIVYIEAPTIGTNGVITAEGSGGGASQFASSSGGGSGSGGSIKITAQINGDISTTIFADGGYAINHLSQGGDGRIALSTQNPNPVLWNNGSPIISQPVNPNTDIINPNRTAPDGEAFIVSAIGINTISISSTGSGGTPDSQLNSSIKAGDTVLLVNAKGTDTSLSNVGAFAECTVGNVSSNQITCTDTIDKLFGETSNANLVGQKIFLQRLPVYENMTILSGAEITASPWNGEYGGVVALRSNQSLIVNGAIMVDGLGYRGATLNQQQGESVGNTVGSLLTPNYGGGGGGRDYYIDPGTGGTTGPGGGGGGGYATAGGDGEYGYLQEPGDEGQGGGIYGEIAMGNVFFGSAGGSSGYGLNCPLAPGGNGGGIVYIQAGTLGGNIGTISANGLDGNGCPGGNYGKSSGGGGAGGSVYIHAKTFTHSDNFLLMVEGGETGPGFNDGGLGGEGRIRIDHQGAWDPATPLPSNSSLFLPDIITGLPANIHAFEVETGVQVSENTLPAFMPDFLPQADTVDIVLKKENTPVAQIQNVTFNGEDSILDYAWNGISADTSGFKSIFHTSSDISLLPGSPSDTFTLFVPKGSGHQYVHVCPFATSLAGVTNTCQGGYSLSNGQTLNGVSASTITDGIQYWKVDGVTGTGIISFSTTPPPVTSSSSSSSSSSSTSTFSNSSSSTSNTSTSISSQSSAISSSSTSSSSTSSTQSTTFTDGNNSVGTNQPLNSEQLPQTGDSKDLLDLLVFTGNEEVDNAIRDSIKFSMPVIQFSFLGLLLALPLFFALQLHLIRSGLFSLSLSSVFNNHMDDPWGNIIDSKSGKPIAFAIIRIFNLDTNHLVDERVSDLKGRYSLLASEGKYRFSVEHQDYESFDDVITLEENHELKLNKDVPLNPLEYSRISIAGFFLKISKLSRIHIKRLSIISFILGIPFSILAAVVYPGIINYTVLLFYIVSLGVYVIIENARHSYWGKVCDNSGSRVQAAFVRLFDPKSNKLIDTQLTNEAGQYGFIVESGTYLILVNAAGFTFPGEAMNRPDIVKSFYGSLIKVSVGKRSQPRLDIIIDRLGKSPLAGDVTMGKVKPDRYASPFANQ